jgi:hypothetical protein
MARQKLDIMRIPAGHAMNKVIDAIRKPRIPSAKEMQLRRLQLAERRQRKEEEEFRSLRFLIEKISDDGISSVKELAWHAGCKPGVVEKLFKKYPELQDQIRMRAEKPRRFAKRALAKQMESISEIRTFDKDVAKVAMDYLKIRGDEDLRGDIGGGAYGGVQINIVGVSPKAVNAEPVRVRPAIEEEDNE